MPDPSPRLLIAALFAAGLVLAPAAPVFAEPIGGVEEVDTDEADLRRALALVREGDAEAAGALTRAVLARAPDPYVRMKRCLYETCSCLVRLGSLCAPSACPASSGD